jgi:hypothetical protein
VGGTQRSIRTSARKADVAGLKAWLESQLHGFEGVPIGIGPMLGLSPIRANTSADSAALSLSRCNNAKLFDELLQVLNSHQNEPGVVEALDDLKAAKVNYKSTREAEQLGSKNWQSAHFLIPASFLRLTAENVRCENRH